MTSMLGKRQRRRTEGNSEAERAADDQDVADLQELLRKHFEAKFEPLEVKTKAADPIIHEAVEVRTQEDEASDWTGLSEDDDEEVEIIVHDTRHQTDTVMGSELRAFMSSKPPTISSLKSTTTSATKLSAKDEPEEALNHKNDLALHRLISESSLLSSSSGASAPVPRQKIAELRMRALGSKRSVLEQRSMPMAHRKGITAKSSERETKRRQEARENGIILEKERREQKKSTGKRERGVGGPAVGKFSGGTLKLSKRDLTDIKSTKTGRPLRRSTKAVKR